MQDTQEWLQLDPVEIDYHARQWDEPKRSTIAFSEFAKDMIEGSQRIADLGCGMGGSTFTLASHYPNQQFVGCELADDLIETGNAIIARKAVSNFSLRRSDWFNLEATNEFDGVVSLQTLSWLPEFEKPLAEIFTKLQPRWIALSSLFYEGDISTRCQVYEHSIDKTCFYNTYSLPAVDRFCKEHGYRISRIQPFRIDIDLEKPVNKDRMATYTVPTTEGERVQISGPVFMNWYFILIEKA